MNAIELSASSHDGIFSDASPRFASAHPLSSPGLSDQALPTSGRSATLLFIDTQVNDYQSLIADVNPGTEIYVLDPTQDAIAQITQTLAGRTGIASLQMLSHGAAGGLQLGSDWVDVQDLDRHANQLQSWAQALTADADILLYGCNVAAGANGQTFVQALANLTSADVAASNNLTGNAAQGGDWDLEVKTGQIETALAFNAGKAMYNNVLAIAGDVIINEFSQGSYVGLTGTAKEWVEILVVTDNLNLQNHRLTDGNNSLDIQLAGIGFSSLKAGTLIVLYNGGDVDPTIAPDLAYNPAIGDYSLQISSLNNTGDFAVTRTIGWNGATGAFSNASTTDFPKLINESGATIFTFPKTPTPGGASGATTPAKASAYLGNSATDAATATNWSPDFIAPGGNPGFANGAANTTWINSLRGNNSPVLNISGNPTLPTISASITNNSNTGLAVADLSNLIADTNNNNKGIAVTKLSGNGTWQYSKDGGTNWTNFGAVSDTSATLLSGSTALFDGSLGSAPNAQGWLQFGTAPSPLNIGVSQTVVGNATRLVTTGAVPAGYSNYHGALTNLLNPTFPTLDRAAGFSLNFDVKINSESHSNNNNRAGFSVIVVTSDNTKAIELGFWANEIWAQNDGTAPSGLFSKGEGVTYTTTTQTSYDLQIKGDTYTLLAGGTTILTGKLRNYTAFDHVGAGLPYDPYERTNFVFLGDNTSEGQANVDIARIDLKTNTRVRFVPTGAGSATIDFRAWDGSNGAANGTAGVNAALNGGATAFSAAIETATIAITPPSTDFLIRDTATGATGFWQMNGMTYGAYVNLPTVAATLNFESTGDFDSDGDLDFLVRDTASGAIGFWQMNAMTYGAYVPLFNIAATVKIESTGDFDGDGKLDFLVRDTATNALGFWKMNGMSYGSYINLFTVAATAKIESTGDFDGDGKLDFLVRDTATGDTGFWKMNGMSYGSYVNLFTVVAGLNFESTGDFDGDGKLDFLIRDTATGKTGFWKMNGMSFGALTTLANVAPSLAFESTGDFDGDGDLDVLVRDTTTGATGFWQMNGMNYGTYVNLATVATTVNFESSGNFDLL